jgi:DNA helicase-4
LDLSPDGHKLKEEAKKSIEKDFSFEKQKSLMQFNSEELSPYLDKRHFAIIARYNYLLVETKTLLWGNELKENIHFWSFHKSKGLEAGYCILIGFFQGTSGFPNENRDDAVVEALLPSLDNSPHSEERRLLYVGLTRAKHKSYIIADPTSPSEFISELLAPRYELNISSKAFQEQYRKMFDCPNCEAGVLRLIKGKFNPLGLVLWI